MNGYDVKEASERVFFECLSAEEAVLQGQCDECDVLVVDPPRKGLDPGVLQLLQGKHAEKELTKGLVTLPLILCFNYSCCCSLFIITTSFTHLVAYKELFFFFNIQ